MASYHESVTPTATETIQLRPYEYAVLPPIGRLLQAIREHCGVGGTIRASVRKLAEWAEYRSAGQIAPLLQQLADDGWILYDSTSGCITLLAESEPISAADRAAISDADRSPDDDDSEAITAADRAAISDADRSPDDDDSEAITATDRAISDTDRSEAISAGDRSIRRPNRLLEAIRGRDRSASRMEDHVLAAADQESDSAAAINKLPCGADSITRADRFEGNPAALVLAELGAEPPIIADALAARPDLTPEQVRASWAHFEPRIAAGRCDAGAFFNAIRGGRLHAAPRDPQLDPAAYADLDGFRLGSDTSDLGGGSSIRDRAERLLPPVTPATIRTAGADLAFVMEQLARGASDDQALDALAVRRGRRGAP